MQRVTHYDDIAGIFKIDSERHSNIVQETGQYENVIENIIQLHAEQCSGKDIHLRTIERSDLRG